MCRDTTMETKHLFAVDRILYDTVWDFSSFEDNWTVTVSINPVPLLPATHIDRN